VDHPQGQDLFAVRWEAEDDDDLDSFRIVEVIEATGDGYSIWCYRDTFSSPPASVDVNGLERVLLHAHLGGPITVPAGEFASWEPVRVTRA
jgi:hypothetical protein